MHVSQTSVMIFPKIHDPMAYTSGREPLTKKVKYKIMNFCCTALHNFFRFDIFVLFKSKVNKGHF